MAKRGDPRLSAGYKMVRLRVLHRDNYVCYYCGGDANQVDHVVPISKQGDVMDMDNMVAACKRCNVSKGNSSQGVFLAKQATPPAFSNRTSPITLVQVQTGPCLGQPSQGPTG
jgi:5-methylcytosine-specific restriction endonuclease McrA